MKTIFTLLASFIGLLGSANTITAVTLSATPGDWTAASTWSPATIPQSGDLVIVPLGTSVLVQSQIYSTAPTLSIKVAGNLSFHPSGKLDLSASSSVQLYFGATITPQNNSASQLVTIGGVTKYNAAYNGTLTGPAYTSSATGTSTSGIASSGWSSGVLPIKLTSFTVAQESNVVRLNWVTAEEQNTSHFNLEKSIDGGTNWTSFETIFAKGQPANYIAYDRGVSSDVIYYRLKTIDADNRYSYSAVVKLSRQRSNSITVTPNPATGFINISLDRIINEKITVRVLNFVGQLVKQSDFSNGSNLLTVDINQLSKGIYTIIVATKNDILDNKSLLVK